MVPSHLWRISGQEAKERREKGLCYYCNDKYTPSHRCIKPQSFAIEDATEEEPDEVNSDAEKEMLKMSLHAIEGTNHPQIIQLPGKLNGQKFTILVDSGSTHNFVDQILAKQCGLVVAKNEPLKVMVANGEQVTCKAVSFSIQDYES